VIKKIQFIPVDEETKQIIAAPEKAAKHLPLWYKNTGKKINPKLSSMEPHPTYMSPGSNLTLKACAPFLDSMTMGYIVALAADIEFVNPQTYMGNRVVWGASKEIVGMHSIQQVGKMQAPLGFSELFKWMFPFRIKSPKGYSCLFMHPSQRYDLPFTTLSGVVDTDKYETNINFPFFLKENFMGIIPKGTPICQIVPIKRNPWVSKTLKPDEKITFMGKALRYVYEGAYKKQYWVKKHYE